MANYKKIFIIFITLLVFPLANLSLAATRELEVPIPGLTVTTLPALPAYIAAIFNFALLAIGLLVFGVLLYGGFRYLTSAGNPTAMNDAKDRIFSAFLGLIILFSSYLILKTINPELLVLAEPGMTPISDDDTFGGTESKVIFYEHNDYMGNSLKTNKSFTDLSSVNWDAATFSADNKISSIKIMDTNYVVVIFEDAVFRGPARLIESSVSGLDNFNDKTSCIVLIKKGASSGRVFLYDGINYQITPGTCSQPFDFYYSTPDFRQLNCDEGQPSFNDLASSIKLETGTVAILYENIGYDGQAVIITQDYPALCILPWGDCNHADNFNNFASSIQIIHGITDLYGVCSSMDGDKAGCEGNANCKWCPKCSSLKINGWGAEKCVGASASCSFTCSVTCGAGGECPTCSAFSWSECSCVPTTCSP